MSALAAGGSLALLVRIAADRRGSLAAGAGVSAARWSSAPRRRRARRRRRREPARGRERAVRRAARAGRSVHASLALRAALRCAAWRRPTQARWSRKRAACRWARRSNCRRRDRVLSLRRSRSVRRARDASPAARAAASAAPDRRLRARGAAADRRPRVGRLRARLRGHGRRAPLLGRQQRRTARHRDRRWGQILPPSPSRAARGPRLPPQPAHCALATDGGVWCWGGNANGQLGSGDRTSRSDPRQVTLAAKAVDVRRFELRARCSPTQASGAGATTRKGSSASRQLSRRRSPGADPAGSERDWTFIATGQGHAAESARPGASTAGPEHERAAGSGLTNPEQIRTPVQVAATPTGSRSAARSRRPARASATVRCGPQANNPARARRR